MKRGYYFIETFGCQMNFHDSEKIASMLIDLGFTKTDDIKKADIIVFNTCCVRESAEHKVMAKIGDTKALKKANKDLTIVVVGCMTQQKGMAELLKKKFPFLSLVLGTYNLGKLETYLKKKKDNRFESIVWDEAKEIQEDTSNFYRESGYNAWVNIIYGCDNFCTYCIVPYVRGRERSRKVEDIEKEVKDLVKDKKYKVITLLGQNVNSYGHDFKDKKIDFVYLLKRLCKIEGDFKISFLSSHPKDFSLKLINFISRTPKMSKLIHLPVQSGSNDVLRRMNRNYSVEKYKKLVTKIYQKIPGVSLTTDIMVGFPGETEEDFNKTCDLLRFCRFSRIFGFVYSKRKGTPASTFDNQISQVVKKQRIMKLFSIQRQIEREDLKNMVGKEFDTIVDSMGGKYAICKTEGGKFIKVKAPLKFGDTLKVRVRSIVNGKLIGDKV